MPYLKSKSGWQVPLDYFSRKPRFRPGYVPYTNERVEVVDDSGKPIPGASIDPRTGLVSGVPEE